MQFTVSPAQAEQFLSRVFIQEDGCWLFKGYLREGYGQIKVRTPNGKQPIGAHRYAYARWVGEVPDGMQLDHLCRNRQCVNPGHLEVVTSRENTLRGEALSARQARQTHCKRGHELSGDNVYRPPKNPTWRHCRACVMERAK